MTGDLDLDSLDTIAKRIRFLRQRAENGRKGINVAKELKVSAPSISAWENGIQPPPWRLRQLAEHFNCPLAWLVKGDGWQGGRKPLNAEQVRAAFEIRMKTALGVAELKPRVISRAQLPFVMEPCAITLLDLEDLDTGRDMLQSLGLLHLIIGWAERACRAGMPTAQQLLFDACDRAVHFLCFVVLARRLINAVTPFFGKMSRAVCFDAKLHARVCARWGDVYKICAAENPEYAALSLQLFERAYLCGDPRMLEYHAFRSPAIVAGSVDMPESDFRKHLARLDAALDSGRFMRRTQVHMTEGRSETNAQRFRVSGSDEDKNAALKDMAGAQRQAQDISGVQGTRNEMLLRTQRLEITLYNLGIKDHISASGMGRPAAVAAKAEGLYAEAMLLGSERIAAAMQKQVRKLTT